MNEELIKLANKIDRLARTARVQDLSLLLSQSEFGDPQDPSTARSRDTGEVEEAATDLARPASGAVHGPGGAGRIRLLRRVTEIALPGQEQGAYPGVEGAQR